MNAALRDAISAGFYVMFTMGCLIALPFPLMLLVFSVDLNLPPDAGIIFMISFLGYAAVGTAARST